MLEEVKAKTGLPLISDIHEAAQVPHKRHPDFENDVIPAELIFRGQRLTGSGV